MPGHERFLRTMLAGAAAIDFALLVAAADDGVMPRDGGRRRIAPPPARAGIG